MKNNGLRVLFWAHKATNNHFLGISIPFLMIKLDFELLAYALLSFLEDLCCFLFFFQWYETANLHDFVHFMFGFGMTLFNSKQDPVILCITFLRTLQEIF